MAEKKSTNRADAVELVDMALGDLKKVAGQLGIENAATLKKAELVPIYWRSAGRESRSR